MIRGRTGRAFDAALTAALAVACVVGLMVTDLPRSREVDVWAVALATLAAGATFWRRTRPFGTASIVTAATSTYLLLGYPYSPILVTFFVAMYSMARYQPLRRSLPIVLAALVLLLLHVVVEAGAADLWVGVIPRAAWVLIPAAVGVAVQQSVESAARSRRELVRRHVHEERMRVSHEVHDVVGHGLAAIKMQADVALHLLHKKPDHAGIALEAISRTSAVALDELRATLATFRQDQDRQPVLGLARLPELQQRMAQAGVNVRLSIEGTQGPLHPDLDLVAYRVVQESLTNVMRHSNADSALVTISYGEDLLNIRVTNADEGSAPDPGMDGFGIDGMRARVENLGGHFDASRGPEGVFTVFASLPMNVEEQ